MILADGYDFDIYNMEVPMELDTLEIGKRIKERRKELRLTQLDIKEKTGISSGNMSDIERGNRLPAANTLLQLSEVLQCSIDYLLRGKSSISENPTTSPPTDLAPQEQDMLKLFRNISKDDQEELLMLAKMKYLRMQKAADSHTDAV